MKTITLLNEKGGVGKTTLAQTLASGLARDGYTVMAIDSDPQGTLTYGMGQQRAPHFYNLIQRKEPWANLARQIAPDRIASDTRGRLFLLPGDRETRNLNVEDAALLLKRLNEIKQSFDYVIIDTAPSASLLHILVYLASDYILYPTQLEMFSMQGLKQSIQVMAEYTEFRAARRLPPIELLGIAPTMTRLNTGGHTANMADLQKTPYKVLRPIHNRIAWSDAAATRRSIFAYDPTCEAAKDADTFINQVKQVLGIDVAGVQDG
jgi:chromosome partitioning protein